MNYIGLDLGQKRDHSALVILSRDDYPRWMNMAETGPYEVRYVERVPLGTPYPAVVEWMREIVAQPEMDGQCALAVDATGVGAPVVEMLRAARLGCEMSAVTITGGERAHQTGSTGSGPSWNVPKRDLMAGVQVLLERGELKIAKGLPETGTLVRELVDVQVSQRGSGAARMGAEGVGKHDDLVIALALAVWRAKPRQKIGFGTQRIPGI